MEISGNDWRNLLTGGVQKLRPIIACNFGRSALDLQSLYSVGQAGKLLHLLELDYSVEPRNRGRRGVSIGHRNLTAMSRDIATRQCGPTPVKHICRVFHRIVPTGKSMETNRRAFRLQLNSDSGPIHGNRQAEIVSPGNAHD